MNSGIENAGSASTEIGARNRKLMVAALMVGAFVSILNETLLNVAYPVLMRQFEVSASTIRWLSAGYMLVVGILVPVTALLLHWFKTRRMFMTAMAIFVAGTALCATARPREGKKPAGDRLRGLTDFASLAFRRYRV